MSALPWSWTGLAKPEIRLRSRACSKEGPLRTSPGVSEGRFDGKGEGARLVLVEYTGPPVAFGFMSTNVNHIVKTLYRWQVW